MAGRSDVRVMANFLLQQVDPLKELILPADMPERRREKGVLHNSIREAQRYISEGHVVALFPAGEVSTYQSDTNLIIDREWQEHILMAIRMAEVPVIPVYFHGTNSRWFHILGRIHPLLRTASLGSELINKRHKLLKVRIGKPVTVKEQAEFSDPARFGRYLRARTYSLGSAIEAKPFFVNLRRRRISRQEPVALPADPAVLREEVNSIRQSYELFTSKNYVVVFAPTRVIPNIIR